MADETSRGETTEEEKSRSSARRAAEEWSRVDDADIDALSKAAIEEMGLDRWPVDQRSDLFEQIGIPDPEVHLFRVELFMGLNELIRAGRVAHTDAAKALGVDAAALDRILRGFHLDITLDQTIRALADLGYRVMPRFFTMPTGQEKTV